METRGVERKKTCPRCRVEFSCYTAGCWCNELPMIMPLNGNEDCLCPDCLRKVIETKIAERT